MFRTDHDGTTSKSQLTLHDPDVAAFAFGAHRRDNSTPTALDTPLARGVSRKHELTIVLSQNARGCRVAAGLALSPRRLAALLRERATRAADKR